MDISLTYLDKFQSIDMNMLSEEVKQELKEIYESTEKFRDPALVNIFKENFDLLYSFIEKQFPDAINNFGFLKKLSDKELEKELDMVKKQLDLKPKSESAISRLQTKEKQIIEERVRRFDGKAPEKPSPSNKPKKPKNAVKSEVVAPEVPKVARQLKELDGIKVGAKYRHSYYGDVTVIEIRENLSENAYKIPYIVNYSTSDNGFQEQGIIGFKENIVKEVKKVTAAPKLKVEEMEHLPEDVVLLKGFLSIIGKIKTRDQILALIKRFQRRIVERKVGKGSNHSKELQEVSSRLVKLHDAMVDRNLKSVNIEADPALINSITKGIEDNKVRYSVNILKRYVTLEGKQPDRKKAEDLYKSITKALESGLISLKDRYIREVQSVKKNLKDFIDKKIDQITIEPVALSGVFKDLGISPEEVSNKKSISGQQISKMKFEVLPIDGRWKELIGLPSANFYAIIYGKPKNGKSHLAYQFSKYLNNFGKVLYIVAEEGISLTTQEKINQHNIPGVEFFGTKKLDEVKEELAKDNYAFIFFDSVNKFNLKPDVFDQFRKDYPHLACINVMQVTKSGNFRGSQEWTHDCDIIIEVISGMGFQNGRFGSGQIDVFENINV